MKVVTGLGNPGLKYKLTRHNVGRLLIEHMAEVFNVSLKKEKKVAASVATVEWDGEKVLLAYPEVYMNHSGESVAKLLHYYSEGEASEILVVVDDFALPFGKLRLRGKGSDGGHNGLKSIEAALGTRDYPRLRLGIAQSEEQPKLPNEPLERFVLGAFEKRELKELPNILERGLTACRRWVREPLQDAMNSVNN